MGHDDRLPEDPRSDVDRDRGGPPMIDRRTLLFGAAAAAVSAETPAMAAETGAANCVWPPPNWQKGGFPSRRWVKILFVHTNERFADIYLDNGVYSMDAVKRFSWAVRDFRANEFHWIEPPLMDLLFILHWKYCKDEIRIFSGYRSPQTTRGCNSSQATRGAAFPPPTSRAWASRSSRRKRPGRVWAWACFSRLRSRRRALANSTLTLWREPERAFGWTFRARKGAYNDGTAEAGSSRGRR